MNLVSAATDDSEKVFQEAIEQVSNQSKSITGPHFGAPASVLS